MPELPEVEIVRQSLNKKIKQKKVKKVIIRNRNLRLKIPSNFTSHFLNKKIIKDWIDYNGHMNLSYYILVFDMGAEVILSKFKIAALRDDGFEL